MMPGFARPTIGDHEGTSAAFFREYSGIKYKFDRRCGGAAIAAAPSTPTFMDCEGAEGPYNPGINSVKNRL